MNSSRTALVAMLIAVEVLLVGLMLFALRGGFGGGHVLAASGFHSVNSTGKTFAPIAAGLAPVVRIDDPSTHVILTTSIDGLIHVKDDSSQHGLVWGSSTIANLTVARTPDGVQISRPAYHSFAMFGMDIERIEVQVPSGSRIEIGHCSAADISGVRNAVDVASQDGHISLTDIRGAVVAHSDDGHLDATDVSGDTLALSTNDGSLHLHDVTARVLDATTSDGRVEAMNLSIDGATPHVTLHTGDGSLHISGRFAPQGTYDFSSGDGSAELTVASGSDLAISASTGNGRIHVDGSSYGDGDSATRTIRLGNGSGAMRLATQDGSIHITTNGAL
jgi:hypothetical protein